MMKKTVSFLLILCLCCSLFLTACKKDGSPENPVAGQENTPEAGTEETGEKVDSEKTDIPEGLTENINTLSVICTEGTQNCWQFEENKLTFSGLTADTVCSLTGDFDGQIVIDGGEDYKFELELCGVTLFSDTQNPIEILSGDKVTITAKKESKNFIYDIRAALDAESEAHSAAVYAACDLDLGGKGELTVISSHNNGIHTKDDLEVKNLTLAVTCADNALKGNDSVEIKGGALTLIAKKGDGIKTANTDISSKGNQRGKIVISGGTVTVYAACDGLDAAYNAEISPDVILNVYTDRYSPYSESVEQTSASGTRYIRFTSKNYNYSVKYYNSDSDFVWVNATYYKSVSGGRSTYYYYTLEKLTGYASVQFFIYSSGQTQGQEDDYTVKSDYLTWNTSYDTFALESRSGSLSYNWTNYSSTVSGGMGGPGGMGGMQDGNSEKGDYSTKGIKAGNEILISGGTVFIKSYDDSLHANSETALENEETPTGNVTISGGSLTLFSKDDGIHADGTLTVSGGEIAVTGSYEGLEGTNILVTSGNISVISSDDGFNATATTGTGIDFEGGKVYIYAGGDGIDANSRTSYKGIVFAGGDITVISTTSMNSSIDTEQGYTYTGGTVLALCPSNGMISETTNCQNFSSIGKKTTMSLKQGQKLSVTVGGNVTVSVTMPCQLSASVLYLGSSSASFSAE